MKPVLAAIAGSAVALLLTAGCGPLPERPPDPWTYGPFGSKSMCDQWGNRVYSGGGYSAIAVIKDGSCPRTAR